MPQCNEEETHSEVARQDDTAIRAQTSIEASDQYSSVRQKFKNEY